MSWLRKSRPVSGSSSTRTRGSATRARAMRIIWNWPPDMVAQGISARWEAPTSSRTSRAMRSSRAPGCARVRMCGARPTITISRPVSATFDALRACGT